MSSNPRFSSRISAVYDKLVAFYVDDALLVERLGDDADDPATLLVNARAHAP
jgi:hypothetical protein